VLLPWEYPEGLLVGGRQGAEAGGCTLFTAY
jgi:hypothetical protein